MFDELVSANTGKSLAARLGNSPDAIAKKAKSKKVAGEKQDKTKKVCVLVFWMIIFVIVYVLLYKIYDSFARDDWWFV